MENVRAGSAVFATAKRTGRKCGIRMSYIGGQFSCNQEVSKVRGAPESQDSIRKAREAFLILKGRTIDPNGLNIREETY